MSNAPLVRRWSKRIPGWARAVLGMGAVVLLAVLVAPQFLPADHYRGVVADLFVRQTGRQVNFKEIHVRILPRFGFVLESFQMRNPEGFARGGEFIAAQQAQCSVDFWQLVARHRLRLTEVELVRPKILFLQDGAGHDNYLLPSEPPRKAGGEESSQASPADISQRHSLSATGSLGHELTEVVLRDGDISWGNLDSRGRVRSTVHVAGFNVVLRHVMLAPLNLDEWQAEGNIRGTRITLAGWRDPITIGSGELKLRGGNLKAGFTAEFGKAARVEGTLSVADVEHPVAMFNLKTGNLDLNSLITDKSSPATSMPHGTDDAAVTDPAHPDERPHGDLVAQGHLVAQRVRAAGYVAGPATADVRLYTDRLEIWPLTVRFERGSVQVSARTDRRQVPERFSANVQARNINVDRILRAWPSLRGRVAGTGELDLQIFGALDAGWVKSLWGKGQFVIRNGRITGLDLASTALPAGELAGGGNTTFTAVSGDLAIRDRRVRSRDIHLYAPRRVADMRGSFDFDGALSYAGQVKAQDGAMPPSLAGRLVAGGTAAGKQAGIVTVPFVLRGTLRHPEIGRGHGLTDFSSAAETSQQGRWNGTPYPNLFGKR